MRKLPHPFVLLDDCSLEQKEGQSLLFDSGEEIIAAYTIRDVPGALKRLDMLVQAGYYLAGWIAYEVAAAFESRLEAVLEVKSNAPLIWMMATRRPQRLSAQEVDHLLTQEPSSQVTLVPDDTIPTLQDYEDKIERILDYISAGDVYQINYTFDQPFTIDGHSSALYAALRQRQPVHFGALINTGELDIVSLSPELFIQCRQGLLTTRPMKGTAPRGASEKEDTELASLMARDEKSRAENLMIVDLLRNDLSRIAEPGSVEVPALFEIETYQTLHQMTSTIQARLPHQTKPSDILAALFPCGSITGAPKIRAMEIISELESRPRGVYCGAIGYFAPDGDFTFSVPIRTATIDKNGQGHLGIGSGIVADSNTKAEYAECLLKARFLTDLNPPYDLIETFKWSPQDGFNRLEQHLNRLLSSAKSFCRPIDPAAIKVKITKAVQSANTAQRIRLTLSRDGTTQVTVADLVGHQHDTAQIICMAASQVSSSNPMLRHKTSNRTTYDRVRKEAMRLHGALDVIFTNEKQEITEGAITNIFADIDGTLVTPPTSCGLLAGIMRQTLLDGPQTTQEAPLTLQDLQAASALYICNSVRGLVPVTLLDVTPVSITDG